MNKYPVTMHVVNDLIKSTVYSTEHVFLFILATLAFSD